MVNMNSTQDTLPNIAVVNIGPTSSGNYYSHWYDNALKHQTHRTYESLVEALKDALHMAESQEKRCPYKSYTVLNAMNAVLGTKMVTNSFINGTNHINYMDVLQKAALACFLQPNNWEPWIVNTIRGTLNHINNGGNLPT